MTPPPEQANSRTVSSLSESALDRRTADNTQTRSEWCAQPGLDPTDVSRTAARYFEAQLAMYASAPEVVAANASPIALAVADLFLYGLLLGRELVTPPPEQSSSNQGTRHSSSPSQAPGPAATALPPRGPGTRPLPSPVKRAVALLRDLADQEARLARTFPRNTASGHVNRAYHAGRSEAFAEAVQMLDLERGS